MSKEDRKEKNPNQVNEMREGFERELQSLINRYSKENESDTPDFILAEYLQWSLAGFTNSVNNREVWYARKTTDKHMYDHDKFIEMGTNKINELLSKIKKEGVLLQSIPKKFTHADLCDTQAKLITKLEQELEWVKGENERLTKERLGDARLKFKKFTHESFNVGNNPLFNKKAETVFDKDPIGARVLEFIDSKDVKFNRSNVYTHYPTGRQWFNYYGWKNNQKIEIGDIGNRLSGEKITITRVINKGGFEFEVGQETSRGKIINFCIDSIMKTNVCANLNTGLVIGATYFNIDELTPNK